MAKKSNDKESNEMRLIDLKYEYDPDSINEIIDSPSNNAYYALRKVRWYEGEDFKFDVRRYYINNKGEEVPAKGTSLSTTAMNNLANILAKNNFGDTHEIMLGLAGRSDFTESVARVTQLNTDFLHELEEAYKYIEEEENNKPINAKDLLDEIL